MRLHKLLMSTADISIGSVSILSVGLLVHDQLRLFPSPPWASSPRDSLGRLDGPQVA